MWTAPSSKTTIVPTCRARQERTLRKKLQQIEALEDRAEAGSLDSQQMAKLAMRPVLESALLALQVGLSYS